MKEKILITGGSGFIGTNLVDYYLNRNCDVMNIDHKPPRNFLHENCWVDCDILNYKKLLSIIDEYKPDFVFHLAARTDLDGVGIEDYNANTDGVRNIIRALNSVGSVAGVVFASSRLVCEIGYEPSSAEDYCPTTMYGKSKVVGEQIVRSMSDAQSYTWVIVRPTSIWGPWFDVPYRTFFSMIRSGKYYNPTSNPIRKSFGFVGNTVFELDSIYRSKIKKLHGKTVYLADYPPIVVQEMADYIAHKFNAPRVKTLNYKILKLLALVGDGIVGLGIKGFPLTSFRLNNLSTNMIYPLDELKDIAGELPYTWREGVDLTCDWMKEQDGRS